MQLVLDGLQHTMSTVMVFQSEDYGRFKMLLGNRELNETKIKRIIKDIDDGIDVLKYYPITVVEKKGRLEILDGQHRYFISKKLKRPVHYIVMKEERQLPDIAKINSNTEKWKVKDFINCYVQQGNKNYEMLQKFMDDYPFTVTVSIKLLTHGNPGTKSGLGDGQEFQRGLFTVNHWDRALEVANQVKLFEEFPVWRDRGFIIAIFRIMEAKKVDMKELLEKCKKFPEMLKKQTGFKEYFSTSRAFTIRDGKSEWLSTDPFSNFQIVSFSNLPMCLKTEYPSKTAAMQATTLFCKNKRVTRRIYYCQECRAWHWVTRRRGVMPMHKKQKYPFKLLYNVTSRSEENCG